MQDPPNAYIHAGHTWKKKILQRFALKYKKSCQSAKSSIRHPRPHPEQAVVSAWVYPRPRGSQPLVSDWSASWPALACYPPQSATVPLWNPAWCGQNADPDDSGWSGWSGAAPAPAVQVSRLRIPWSVRRRTTITTFITGQVNKVLQWLSSHEYMILRVYIAL